MGALSQAAMTPSPPIRLSHFTPWDPKSLRDVGWVSSSLSSPPNRHQVDPCHQGKGVSCLASGSEFLEWPFP